MEENENLFDKLQELFGTTPGSFNILEQQIDINLQMSYFDYSRRVKKGLIPRVVMRDSEKLFMEKADSDLKKELLVKLASVEEVQAYRIIERFYDVAPDDLKEWAALAFKESKMMLESKFLDENQVLISTGLGGKGLKLRYFVVILGKLEKEFTQIQKKIISSEFRYILKLQNAEVENINFSGSISTIMAVVPIKIPVKSLFEKAIRECNTYGNFLKDNFILTNVKVLSFDEIRDFLKKRKREESYSDGENDCHEFPNHE